MTLGILLLDPNNYYVGPQGELPVAPAYDKKILFGLSIHNKILISSNTYYSLPKNLREDINYNFIILEEEEGELDEYDINWGIKSLYTNTPDILLVVKSKEVLPDGGKKFNPEDLFTLVVDFSPISIWRRSIDAIDFK